MFGWDARARLLVWAERVRQEDKIKKKELVVIYTVEHCIYCAILSPTPTIFLPLSFNPSYPAKLPGAFTATWFEPDLLPLPEVPVRIFAWITHGKNFSSLHPLIYKVYIIDLKRKYEKKKKEKKNDNNWKLNHINIFNYYNQLIIYYISLSY